jgi:hypothetical protein
MILCKLIDGERGDNMERGNLIIYDLQGTIITQTGDAKGDVLPHAYPVGVPYIELAYGETVGKRIIRVDVSVEPHEVVTEDLQIEQTAEEKITELEAQLAALQAITE